MKQGVWVPTSTSAHLSITLLGVEMKEIDYAINEVDRLYNDTEAILTSQFRIGQCLWSQLALLNPLYILVVADQMMQARRSWGWHTHSDRVARERWSHLTKVNELRVTFAFRAFGALVALITSKRLKK